MNLKRMREKAVGYFLKPSTGIFFSHTGRVSQLLCSHTGKLYGSQSQHSLSVPVTKLLGLPQGRSHLVEQEQGLDSGRCQRQHRLISRRSLLQGKPAIEKDRWSKRTANQSSPIALLLVKRSFQVTPDVAGIGTVPGLFGSVQKAFGSAGVARTLPHLDPFRREACSQNLLTDAGDLLLQLSQALHD
jgi:hypothetical protein